MAVSGAVWIHSLMKGIEILRYNGYAYFFVITLQLCRLLKSDVSRENEAYPNRLSFYS